MKNESDFIKECLRLIECRLNWKDFSEWKQRDYEYLSNLIYEKSKIQLSVSTLKRIWKNNRKTIPHQNTLDALAKFIDYPSWNEFKQKYIDVSPSKSISENKEKVIGKTISNKRKFNRYLGISIALSVVIMIVIIFILKEDKTELNQNYEKVEFYSKSMSEGVPNSVVFNYDISEISFDSAFIQQSWNPKLRVKILKENTSQTCIYYYPGFYTAKLLINDSIIKQHKIHVTTKDWQLVANQKNHKDEPVYLPYNKSMSDGMLYVSPEYLKKNNFDISSNQFFIKFFYSADFGKIYGSDFIFETKVKNSVSEGGLACQYCYITLLCENGGIQIPLSAKGCISNINARFGQQFLSGKTNDLSAFGCDMNNFHKVYCKVKNNELEVLLDDVLIKQIKIKADIGKIVGVAYKFYGCGAVESAKLSSLDDEVHFEL